MLPPVEFEGMTGIGPTLKARNDVVLGSQYVHDFSFPFVSPLETEQYVDFHRSSVKLAKISPTQLSSPEISRGCPPQFVTRSILQAIHRRNPGNLPQSFDEFTEVFGVVYHDLHPSASKEPSLVSKLTLRMSTSCPLK